MQGRQIAAAAAAAKSMAAAVLLGLELLSTAATEAGCMPADMIGS